MKRFAVILLLSLLVFSSVLARPNPDGIEVPEGFKISVFHKGIGRWARHMAVNSNGDVYVNIRRGGGGGIVALRDSDQDGRVDTEEKILTAGGTGIDIFNNHLYFATESKIYRYRLSPDKLLPEGEPEIIVGQLANQKTHSAKPIAFDSEGNLFVSIGAPSNACQKSSRTPGSPGMTPCPHLRNSAGIWRFRSDKIGQRQKEDGYRYATGIRNAVGLAWHPGTKKVYITQHGRDQLSQLFPKIYSDKQNAELPSEEFHELKDGSHIGWPYTYWDHLAGKRKIAPEYGGNGKKAHTAGRYQDPAVAMPGHWAPNDLIIYTGTQFPEKYRGGAFVALHGSWNRAPLEQRGYKVVFLPFENGKPKGTYEVFANGFAGPGPVRNPADATYRPMGLGVSPDGSLYVVDSVRGRMWKVSYGLALR